MKKMLKRTSALLAAVMTVTSMGFTAFADGEDTAVKYYSDSEVYYNDFSGGSVSTFQNRINVWDGKADLTENYILHGKRNNNGNTAEIVNGQLQLRSKESYLIGTDGKPSGEFMSRTWIRFDKDFNVGSDITKKLIVSYDVIPEKFQWSDTWPADKSKNIDTFAIGGGLFEYEDETKNFKQQQFKISSPGGNIRGLAFQIPYSDTLTVANNAEKFGLFSKIGSWTTMISEEGNKYSGGLGYGIFNRPVQNVFHVEYEVTPATVTGEGEEAVTNPARLAKITISDGKYEIVHNTAAETQYNLTDAVSGIMFNNYHGVDYDIDNIKAYYEGALKAPTATHNEADLNGATVSSMGFTATVNFAQAVSEAEAKAIKVDGAVTNVTLADDKKTATVAVSGLKKDGKYKLAVPATELNLAADFEFKTEAGDFWVQDFSQGTVKLTTMDRNVIQYQADMTKDDIVQVRTNVFSEVSVNVKDGKLSTTTPKYAAGGGNNGSGTMQVSKTYVKFNKDYDISSNVNEKLIVGYDVNVNKVFLPENSSWWKNYMFIGGDLFKYVDSTTNNCTVFAVGNGMYDDNGMRLGMAIEAVMSETGEAEKAGLFVKTGNRNLDGLKNPTEGLYNNDGQIKGIIERPLGNVFHVEYEVTPATETKKAQLSKVTISDDKYETSYVSSADKLNIDVDKISGIRFDAWMAACYDIDNISVGYEYAYNAPVVKYGETQLDKAVEVPVNTSTFTYTVDSRLDVTDVSGIELKDENGTPVDVTAAVDGNNVTITVNGALASDTNYTLTLPNSATGSISTVGDAEYSFKTKWEEKAFVKPEMFKDKEDLNVVFLGGSITQMNSYRPYVEGMIKEQYPNANMINSGIGGTGSDYGFKRLQRDVINKNPDLVFIEFTVNDSNMADESIKEMESIVRTLNSLEKRPAIAFITLCHQDVAKTDKSYAAHKAVADAYGIPVINVKGYIEAKRIADSEFKEAWDAKGSEYISDGTHPGEPAAKLYGEYICNIISSDPDKYIKLPKTNDEVAKLSTESKETAESFILEALSMNKNADGTEVTASATYFAATEKPMRLILATYNADNEVTGVKFSDLTKASTACAKTAISASIPVNDDDVTVRAFVWDSANGMTPIADDVSLNLNAN